MVVPITTSDVFQTHCYFLIDRATSHGFLIDCGAQGDAVVEMIRQRGWVIEGILLTHGHFDHTAGVAAVQRKLKCPVYIHEADKAYLTDTSLNLSAHCGRHVVLHDVQQLKDGDVISHSGNANCSLQVIHTPGHTPGSCTYFNKDEAVAFVGDTIFRDQPGTSEYPGGNESDLIKSIDRILQLPDNTTLYSGHSTPTTIIHEKKNYRL